MTGRMLILGLVCWCCSVETGNAGLNDRTQKLLETQATNRPTINSPTNKSSAPGGVNARPSYGPTQGVFSPPASARSGAGAVVPPKR
jgi:hypothetical protein